MIKLCEDLISIAEILFTKKKNYTFPTQHVKIVINNFKKIKCSLFFIHSAKCYIQVHTHYTEFKIMKFANLSWRITVISWLQNWVLFKGTVQQDFDQQFFHNSNIPGPLTNGLNYFWFWLRIHRVIRFFQSPRGRIPRWVNIHGYMIP